MERLLIVDDEPGIRMLLKDYFEMTGYETWTAENGREAVELAKKQPDKINGLLSGGDDYITKPFSIDELGVRVMAHLRREKRGRQSKKESEETKGFRIRYDERSVRFDGEEIRLTKTEFDILEFLSMHPRQVFSKEQIYEAVRGLEGNGDNSIVTEHIRRLRGKIAQKTKEDYIETVWGVGYKWIGFITMRRGNFRPGSRPG